MGDPRGFLKIKREGAVYRPVCERIKDYQEVSTLRADIQSEQQASRCMDCGTPFCHWACPVGNYIPEWNDLIFNKRWRKAYELLEATNNLPEVTGRLCPALCEYSCVLGINDEAATIRENELSVIEYAFKHGLVNTTQPKKKTGNKIAIIGSGPAGLSAADQLNKAGHDVVVFEKGDRPGGLLRYGIPDFKLEKWVIDRRIGVLKKRGIKFICDTNAGVDYSISKMKKEFDAILLAGGSRTPRDLNIEGRSLKGIYFAMDYLVQSNKRALGEKISQDEFIDAKGKKVVVIGGGDTGADCVGTANRQGASCVVQIELLDKPPECRTEGFPWPEYPLLLKTSTSHEEGGLREWSVLTKKFIGEKGNVKKLFCARVDFSSKDENGCPVMREIRQSEFEIEADLVILALGFVHPERAGLLSKLKVGFDRKGNVKIDAGYMTSQKKVFCAGDMHRGQSLIVWAISEGRQAAEAINKYLAGT